MATPSSITIVRYDLAHFGIVASVLSPTVFAVNGLVGFGVGAFIGNSLFVSRKATGTGLAPQGETQVITGYVNSTGQITIAAGFTVAISVGDEILVTPVSIASVGYLHGMTPVSSSVIANWNAAEQVVCVIGTASTRYKVHSLIIDIMATSGNITPRMYISVNGVQREIFPTKSGTTFNVPAGDAPGVALINGTYGIANILTITAQSDNVADNGQAIGYEYFLEAM